MIYNYEKIKYYLEKYIEEVDIKEVLLGYENPMAKESYKQLLPWSRLIIPLSGEKTICFSNNGQIEDYILKPGQALFLPPFCWSIPRWTSSHEMISIVFERHYLRALYIKHDEGMVRGFRSPDYYFHVEDSISLSTLHLVQTLSSLAYANDKSNCNAVKLVECLISFTLNDIIASNQKTHSQAYCTWLHLKNHIKENFNHKITRYSIAEDFCITPQYVSKLFKIYSPHGFNAYLNWTRLHNAASLLENTKMRVEEISWQCGFIHNSHFIKLFRLEFGLSPGRYRARIVK